MVLTISVSKNIINEPLPYGDAIGALMVVGVGIF